VSLAHRIVDPAAMRAFVGAGNAYFTLRNAATGGRVTYNVTREDDGTFTVRTFTGSDNGDRRHYSYLGTIDADGRYTYADHRAAVASLAAVAAETGDRWLAGFCASLSTRARMTPRQQDALNTLCRKHKVNAAAIPQDDVRARGFAWFWSRLGSGTFPATFEFWHEGRCAACARRLTVPQSIATGFGPDCADRLGIIQITLPLVA
jgi:hypothetical protein